MVQVKNLEIGTGMPKICVPIVEEKQGQILNRAQEIGRECADLVEWRADYFEDAKDYRKAVQTAGLLQEILGEIPLLFTFRTAAEGGRQRIAYTEYEQMLLRMAESGYTDLVDVEAFRGYDRMQRKRKDWRVADICNQPLHQLVRKLSGHVAVIGSYHDFEKTPSREEMLKRLLFMDKLGVAIPKLAVMPQEEEDVICLMETTLLATRLMVDRPIITMAMGPLGTVTRLAGEVFGSAVTFGCIGKASAPGQIEAEKLAGVLPLLHRGGNN